MRIAIISPLPPEQSGIADYAQAFSHALEAAGLTVSTPFRAQALSPQPDGLHQQMQAVNWQAVDLVHVELGGGRNAEYLAVQWLARHMPDLPVTATVHDPDRLIWKPALVPGWMQRLPRALYQVLVLLRNPLTLVEERKTAAHLAAIVTLTRTGAQSLTERMRLKPGQVHTIPHGNLEIPGAPLPPLPGNGPLKLLYFGFIYRGKGIEDLIDALEMLAFRQPDTLTTVELTLAGGTQPDMAFGHESSYLDSLRQRLQDSGLAQLTVNWRLDINQVDIPALIQDHHVMILPYHESLKLAWLGRMHGTSGALSWAAACGRCVIASDARAFAEEVAYGNGVVYPQGDCAALAHEIARLLADPEILVQRCHAAGQLGIDRGWSRVAQQFRDLFWQVAQGRTA